MVIDGIVEVLITVACRLDYGNAARNCVLDGREFVRPPFDRDVSEVGGGISVPRTSSVDLEEHDVAGCEVIRRDSNRPSDGLGEGELAFERVRSDSCHPHLVLISADDPEHRSAMPD